MSVSKRLDSLVAAASDAECYVHSCKKHNKPNANKFPHPVYQRAAQEPRPVFVLQTLPASVQRFMFTGVLTNDTLTFVKLPFFGSGELSMEKLPPAELLSFPLSMATF